MKRLMKAAVMIAIGCAVGYVFGALACSGGTFDKESTKYIMFLFSGFPFGWSFIQKHLPGITITGNIGLIAGLFAIKVGVCVIIGWPLMLVEVARGIYELIVELKERGCFSDFRNLKKEFADIKREYAEE